MRYAGFLVTAAALTTFAIVGRITIDELPVAIRASRMVNIASTQPAPYVVPVGRTLVMTGLQTAAYLQNTVVSVSVNGVQVVREDLADGGKSLAPNLIAPSGASVVVSVPSAGVAILTGYLD